MRTLSIQVVSIDGDAFLARVPRKRAPQAFRLADVLSAGYARGDEGM